MEKTIGFTEQEIGKIITLIKKLDVIIEEATFKEVEGSAVKALAKVMIEKQAVDDMILAKFKKSREPVGLASAEKIEPPIKQVSKKAKK